MHQKQQGRTAQGEALPKIRLMDNQALGSTPNRSSSLRPNVLNQLAKLIPASEAAVSNCSFNSGVIRTWKVGAFPFPFGCLSLCIIVDMYVPIALVLNFIGTYLNTVRSTKTAKPQSALTLMGLLTVTLWRLTLWLSRSVTKLTPNLLAIRRCRGWQHDLHLPSQTLQRLPFGRVAPHSHHFRRCQHRGPSPDRPDGPAAGVPVPHFEQRGPRMNANSLLSDLNTRAQAITKLAATLQQLCDQRPGPMAGTQLAELLAPLAQQLDDLELMSAGTALNEQAEQANRFVCALLALLLSSRDPVSSSVLAAMLIPIISTLADAEHEVGGVSLPTPAPLAPSMKHPAQIQFDQAAMLTSSLCDVCNSNTERMLYLEMADLLRPLQVLIDQLEVCCVGTPLAEPAEQVNRYTTVLLKVIEGNQSHTEPCVISVLLAPVNDVFEAVELAQLREGV